MSTPGWMSGLPALPSFAIRPSLIAMSHLTMPHQSITSALVITVSAQSLRHALALAHAVADHLAAAELHFLAVDGEIALDLDDELGVGEAHAIADRRAEHLGIGAAADLHRVRLLAVAFARGRAARSLRPARRAAPSPRRGSRRRCASPASATSSTVRACPGSKRTAVPAGDVEPEAARRGAIERERRVGLGEVVVRADLDRTIAGVGDARA